MTRSALIRGCLPLMLLIAAPAPALAAQPIANDDDRTYDEDDCVLAFPSDCIIPVLLNDTDANGNNVSSDSEDSVGNPIKITALTDLAPAFVAAARRDDDTQIGIQLARNYCNTGRAPDAFTYTISEGDTATARIRVNCVDDNPVAVFDGPRGPQDPFESVDEDSDAALYDVLANDTDADRDTADAANDFIEIASVGAPENGGTAGVVKGSGSRADRLWFKPKPNACGSDSIPYTVNGGSKTTLFVDIVCRQDLPVANADTFAVGFNAGTTFLPVVANDTDADDLTNDFDDIPIIAVTQPLNGTAQIVQGVANRTDQIAYTPNQGFCGTDSFIYRVFRDEVPPAQVTVTVPCPARPSGGSIGGSGAATIPAAKASAKAGKVKVAGTALTVPLTCAKPAACTMSLTLSIAGKSKASKTKTVAIAKASVTLKPGQTRTVTLKLNRAGRRAFSKSRKLTAKLRIMLGGKTIATRTVTFKAAAKKR